MPPRYITVAFDLDGTLSNPSHGLVESFYYALTRMGVDFGTKASLSRYIGPPLYDTWREEYGFSPEETQKALAYFHDYFDVYGWWDNRLYPGIRELLLDLKAAGCRVAVATSKPEVFTVKILKLFGILDLFDAVGAAANDKDRDKKWEVLRYSLDCLGVTDSDLAKTVLIGDRRFDAEGAKIVGVDSIGVTYGLGSRAELESAGFTHLVSSVGEIKKLLLSES